MVLLFSDIQDEPEKSELIIYDPSKNLILHKMTTDRIIEAATFKYRENEESEEVIVLSCMHLIPEGLKGKIRVCKIG